MDGKRWGSRAAASGSSPATVGVCEILLGDVLVLNRTLHEMMAHMPPSLPWVSLPHALANLFLVGAQALFACRSCR